MNKHWKKGIIGAALLLAGALWGHSAWILAKAYCAKWMIHDAWETTLNTGHATRPWHWADTWPVARLQVPRLGVDQLVLAGAQGASLAFGPGHLDSSAEPNSNGHVIFSGHRDTHFRFLAELQRGEVIRVQDDNTLWRHYVVDSTAVRDIRDGPMALDHWEDRLTLVTCYPFDALTPGGPLRYVVSARPMSGYFAPGEKQMRMLSQLNQF